MSEELTFSIVAGILSGLVTAFIIFISAFMSRKHLIPWLSDQIYRGIRVDGNWSLIDDDSICDIEYSQDETFEITQKAGSIFGRVILVPKDGKGVTRTLTFEGVVRDRFVLLTAVPSTRRNLGYLAYLGEIQSDGTEIRGEAVYYHIEDGGIGSVKANYKRELSE